LLYNKKKKKKKKKIYNAQIVQHEAWIGGAGSRQVAGRIRPTSVVNKCEELQFIQMLTATSYTSKTAKINKMLSYRRETALQGRPTLVLAESGILELRDNILLIL